jgi:plasmid stabilization system protein ParE
VIRFHPRAEADLASILAWYRADYPERDVRFQRALVETLASIEFSPLGFTVFDPPDIRSAPLRKFPQSVIYVPIREDVEVLAIFDGRRRPGAWR